MPSSTSRRGSFDHGLLWWLFAGIAGTPLLWLVTLQAGYVLAYQACDARSTSWVIVPTLAALVLTIGLAVSSVRSYRRAAADRLPLPLLGGLALAVSVLIVIVLAASAIGPLILQACD